MEACSERTINAYGHRHNDNSECTCMNSNADIESVWDYPRPPRVESCPSNARVEISGRTVANSRAAYRLLETSHPPTVYFPRTDVATDLLVPNPHRSFCEWKGVASYYDLVLDDCRIGKAAWYYLEPHRKYEQLAGYIAFYPEKMSACYLGDERVQFQEGDFYGGWITSNLKGPFKGGPGTSGW